jgi:hypothetical protein
MLSHAIITHLNSRFRPHSVALALIPLFSAPVAADQPPPYYSVAVPSANYAPVKPPASTYAFDKAIEKALKFGADDGKYGQIKFDLRYRYEHVDNDGPLQNANANTLRLRAGYLTPQFYGFQGFAEYQGLVAMQEDYNSTRNNLRQYSIVADPQASELDQLWLSYKGIPDTNIIGGRQRIKLDDDRFIGNVGWRQLEQTYDGALIVNKSIPKLTATAGYIGHVQSFNTTNDAMTSPFVNLNYKVGDYGYAVAYAYFLDYDNPAKYTKSSQSYGLRFDGAKQLNEKLGLVYTAEWSTQANYRNNPNNYQVDRFLLNGGFSLFGLTVSGAMEQLNGAGALGKTNALGNNSFQTPLGTNHVFQGWADVFLTTPSAGIRDVYTTISSQVVGTNMAFVYHDFMDDTGKAHYGDEYDFIVTRKFGPHYQLLAKYAYYNADTFFTNTQKIWVQGDISF